MTQEPPNQPNPENRNNSENQRTSRPQKNPSFLKLQTIKLLRGAIAILEGTVEKLEADPSAPLLPSLPSGWRRFIRPIRIFLPASINRKLSDWGLTGAIAGLLLVAVWTAIALLPPEPAAQVAQVPPSAPTEIGEFPPGETEEEVAEIPETEVPEVTENPPEETEELPPLSPSLETSEEVEESEVPVETNEPEPIEDIVEEPEVELSPEQILIASIQEQIADVTSQYADGLIQSIKADFRGSLLIVNIGNKWYSLSEYRQDKLANKMLEQAQDLDFSTLEITDSEANLVARSPVVGSQMIILRRSLQEELPEELLEELSLDS